MNVEQNNPMGSGDERSEEACSLERLVIRHLAAEAVAWMRRYNEDKREGTIGVIVPTEEDLIEQAVLLYAGMEEGEVPDNAGDQRRDAAPKTL